MSFATDVKVQGIPAKIAGNLFEFKIAHRGTIYISQKYGSWNDGVKKFFGVQELPEVEANDVIIDFVVASLLWKHKELTSDDIKENFSQIDLRDCITAIVKSFGLSLPEVSDNPTNPSQT